MGKRTYLRFYFLVPVLALLFGASSLSASDLSSTNFIIRDPVIGTQGGRAASDNFGLFSTGDKLFTGSALSDSFLSRYGFEYYPYVIPGTLSATPAGSNANLSWSASTAGGGWNVSGYKTGKSGVSGGPYAYTLVGNVLSYSYTSLAPGDYCFVVETLDAFDHSIATSNEQCITVTTSIAFDIDTPSDFGNGESSSPYSVPLGTLSTSSVTHSDGSSVKMIVVEGDSSGPMTVTVQNANGPSGLVSGSAPSDDIGSSAASMAAGTENYGLCVATAGLSGFSRASPYDSGTCALGSGTNAVKALSLTAQNILDSGSPISGAHAEIVVNASASGTTPAHTDYADTLTFIATSSF